MCQTIAIQGHSRSVEIALLRHLLEQLLICIGLALSFMSFNTLMMAHPGKLALRAADVSEVSIAAKGHECCKAQSLGHSNAQRLGTIKRQRPKHGVHGRQLEYIVQRKGTYTQALEKPKKKRGV